MAEDLEMIKNRLESLLEVNVNEKNLFIILNVKGEIQKSEKLAEPHEVKDMLHIFGGLKEEISMEIEIDNITKSIKLIFTNKEDLDNVRIILDNMWERIIHIFDELEQGNANVIRGIGDFSD